MSLKIFFELCGTHSYISCSKHTFYIIRMPISYSSMLSFDISSIEGLQWAWLKCPSAILLGVHLDAHLVERVVELSALALNLRYYPRAQASRVM